jgi:phage repressor protein C with HTH and peptisase S24 domain
MPDNKTISERIKEYRDSKKIKKTHFEALCGLSNGYLNSVSSPSAEKLEAILRVCSDLNREWVITGVGEMINHASEVNDPPVKYELKEKEYTSHLEVKLVTTKARAGFSESYYAEEYLEDMPTLLIEADKEYRGKYLAFEVDGDSMEPEYHPGDVVICREIKRDLWRYKLHYDTWDFVIAHGTKGIMLKQIMDHNVETGDIVCHSINSDMHPDFTINLREVAFLYNVVEHRISGKSKRRYR